MIPFGASPDLLVHSDLFGLGLTVAAIIALCVAQIFDLRPALSRVRVRRAATVALALCLLVAVLVINRFIVLR